MIEHLKLILKYFQTNSTTLKVIHLADIHWDSEYLEGSLANCRDPLCCRASSGPVNNTADAAGYWGDYRSCDLPWRTIENAVVHMAKQHSVFGKTLNCFAQSYYTFF
jgi:sphingomyelin phosphodiesterase